MPARSISASVPSTVSTATRLSCRLPTLTLASNTGTLGLKSKSTFPTLSPSPQPSPVKGEGVFHPHLSPLPSRRGGSHRYDAAPYRSTKLRGNAAVLDST